MKNKESLRILLAEDEPKLSSAVKQFLEEQSYCVEAVFDGNAAEHVFAAHPFHLVLLDIGLPNQSGFELCKKFRTIQPHVPIIIITALGEIDDKLTAFDAGADDYLVKPFHFSELLAKIKVFIKRAADNTSRQTEMKIADLTIDFLKKTVSRNNMSIELTVKEFALLELLARSKGQIVSKPEIAEKVWDIDFDTGTNTIEVYINFLRKKIDKDFEPKLIHTKTGFGYFLKALES